MGNCFGKQVWEKYFGPVVVNVSMWVLRPHLWLRELMPKKWNILLNQESDLACVHSVRFLLEQCVQFYWGTVQGRCCFLQDIFNLTSDKNCVICLYWTGLCQYYSVKCKPESNLKHCTPSDVCVAAYICRRDLGWLVWLQASEVTAWNYELYRGRVMASRSMHACAHAGDGGARKDLCPWLPGFKLPSPGCPRALPLSNVTQLCIHPIGKYGKFGLKCSFDMLLKYSVNT